MFGTKTKKEVSRTMGSANSMATVTSKIDSLQTAIEQEQIASAAAPVVDRTEELQNVIGRGTVIEGNVTTEGDLTIEGIVKGDVTTKKKLVVGSHAVIEGNILSQHAEIAGRVQGTVKALGLLVINSSGTILGDVITKDLNVESGSTFNGRLQVGGTISTTRIEIPKPSLSMPVAPAVTSASDSVFDAPAKKPAAEKLPVMSAKHERSDSDKTADQLAANLAKSALLH